MKKKIDWGYWGIILAFVVVIVLIIIPKIEVTIIEKEEITKCVCNCKCPEEREYFDINWSKVEPAPIYKFNFTDSNWSNINFTFWNNILIINTSGGWYRECRGCWKTS